MSGTEKTTATAWRNNQPQAYRLAQTNGTTVLQGLFISFEPATGIIESWETIPTVVLDEHSTTEA